MVFNVTFNNISIFMEETGENHRPDKDFTTNSNKHFIIVERYEKNEKVFCQSRSYLTSACKTFTNVASSTPRHERDLNSQR
jgi:hypothetical protein